MPLPLTYYGNPILRKKASPVKEINDELLQFIKEMEETLYFTKGLGLAAPQVNRSIAVFLTNVPIFHKEEGEDKLLPGKLRIFINPKVSNPSDEAWIFSEGCLSIPGVYEDIVRPFKISVEAMDIEGNIFTEEFSGLEARAIMHENDHLNGVLIVDRIHGKRRQALEPVLREIKKKFAVKS